MRQLDDVAWCIVHLRMQPEPNLADKNRLGENASA